MEYKQFNKMYDKAELSKSRESSSPDNHNVRKIKNPNRSRAAGYNTQFHQLNFVEVAV
jgi:hypothetical protein